MAIARMILSSRHGAAYGAALCWLGLLAAPARAQVSVELGPYLGVYVPTSSFESAAQSSLVSIPSTSRHAAAVLVGAQGTLWLGSPIGVAADWWSSSSKVRTSGVLGDTEASAKVNAWSLRLLFRLPTASLPGRVHLDAGVGVLNRSGDFYDGQYRKRRNVGGLLGLGSELPIAPRLRVHLGLGTYLYSLQLRETGGTEHDSAFQADVTARAGLSLALGR